MSGRQPKGGGSDKKGKPVSGDRGPAGSAVPAPGMSQSLAPATDAASTSRAPPAAASDPASAVHTPSSKSSTLHDPVGRASEAQDGEVAAATRPSTNVREGTAHVGGPATLHALLDEQRREMERLRQEVHRLRCSARPASAPGEESKDVADPAEVPNDAADLLLAGGGSGPPDLLLVSLMMQMQEMRTAMAKLVASTITRELTPVHEVPVRVRSSVDEARAATTGRLDALEAQVGKWKAEQESAWAAAATKMASYVADAARSAAEEASRTVLLRLDEIGSKTSTALHDLGARVSRLEEHLGSVPAHVQHTRSVVDALQAQLGRSEATVQGLPTTQAVRGMLEDFLARERLAHSAAADVARGTQIDARSVVEALDRLEAAQQGTARSVAALATPLHTVAEAVPGLAATCNSSLLTARNVEAGVQQLVPRVNAVESSVGAVGRGVDEARRAGEERGREAVTTRSVVLEHLRALADGAAAQQKALEALQSQTARTHDGVQASVEHLISARKAVDTVQATCQSAQDALVSLEEQQREAAAELQAVAAAVKATSAVAADHAAHVWDAVAAAHQSVSQTVQSLPPMLQQLQADLRALASESSAHAAQTAALRKEQREAWETASDTLGSLAAASDRVLPAMDETSAAVKASVAAHTKHVEDAIAAQSGAAATAAESAASASRAAQQAIIDELQRLQVAVQGVAHATTEIHRSSAGIHSAMQLAANNSEEIRNSMDNVAKQLTTMPAELRERVDAVPAAVRDAVGPQLAAIHDQQQDTTKAAAATAQATSDIRITLGRVDHGVQQLVERPAKDETLHKNMDGALAAIAQLGVNLSSVRDHLDGALADVAGTHSRAQEVTAARVRSLDENTRQMMDVLQRGVQDVKKNLGALSDSTKLGMHARGQEARELRSDLATIFTMVRNIAERLHAMATQRLASSNSVGAMSPSMHMLSGVLPSTPAGEDGQAMARTYSTPILEAPPVPGTPGTQHAPAQQVSDGRGGDDEYADDGAPGGSVTHDGDGSRTQSRARARGGDTLLARKLAAEEAHRERLRRTRRPGASETPSTGVGRSASFAHPGEPDHVDESHGRADQRRASQGSAYDAADVEERPIDRAATAPRQRGGRSRGEPVKENERQRIAKLYERFGLTPRHGGSVVSGDDGSTAGFQDARGRSNGRGRRRHEDESQVEVPATTGVSGAQPRGQQWVSIRFPQSSLAATASSPAHALPLPPPRSRSKERLLAAAAAKSSKSEAGPEYRDFTRGTNPAGGSSMAASDTDYTVGGGGPEPRGDLADDDAGAFMAPYGRNSGRRNSTGSVGSVDSAGRPRTGPRMVLYA